MKEGTDIGHKLFMGWRVGRCSCKRHVRARACMEWYSYHMTMGKDRIGVIAAGGIAHRAVAAVAAIRGVWIGATRSVNE